jgi:hypothetical protein
VHRLCFHSSAYLNNLRQELRPFLGRFRLERVALFPSLFLVPHNSMLGALGDGYLSHCAHICTWVELTLWRNVCGGGRD